jgi:hypothetical protein
MACTQRATSQIDDYVGTIQTNGTTNCNFDNAVTDDATAFGFLMDRSAVAASEGVMYVNGTAQGTVSTSGAGSTGSATAATWSIGSEGSNPSLLGGRTLLIYETAQAAGTFGSIAALIRPSQRTNTLDSFTSNLWGLYSMRKQLTAYAGSCMRVRRSSDNAEQDIGFASGVIDTAAMVTFGGVNVLTVKTWYDQSGGGHDLTQTTNASQPQIMGAAALNRGVTFDGANDFMSSGNSGTPSAFTVFLKGNIESTGDQILFEQTTSAATHTGCVVFYDSPSRSLCNSISQTSNANLARSFFTCNAVGQVVTFRMDRSQGTGAAEAVLFSGGTKLTRSASGDVGTLPSGNFTAAAWFLGCRSGGTVEPAFLDAETFVIYEAAVSDANVNRISRAIG